MNVYAPIYNFHVINETEIYGISWEMTMLLNNMIKYKLQTDSAPNLNEIIKQAWKKPIFLA